MIYSLNDAYQTISAASSEVLMEEKTHEENIHESKREFIEQHANNLLEYKEAILQQLNRDKEKALKELSAEDLAGAADRIKNLQEIGRRNVEKGIADMKNIRDRVYSIENLAREPLDSQDEYAAELYPDLKYEAIFALGKVTSHDVIHQDHCSDDDFNQFSGCLKFATLP